MELEADELPEIHYQKGVKHLCNSGAVGRTVPNKYIFPPSDRAASVGGAGLTSRSDEYAPNLNLPVIDFSHLQGSNRSIALNNLSKACQNYGFFQVLEY